MRAGQALAAELVVNRRSHAVVRASSRLMPRKKVLLARLYREEGETLFLCGSTDSFHKGICLFEFLFEKGRYQLIAAFRQPRQEKGIVHARTDISYGTGEDHGLDSEYPITLTLQS